MHGLIYTAFNDSIRHPFISSYKDIYLSSLSHASFPNGLINIIVSSSLSLSLLLLMMLLFLFYYYHYMYYYCYCVCCCCRHLLILLLVLLILLSLQLLLLLHCLIILAQTFHKDASKIFFFIYHMFFVPASSQPCRIMRI